MTTLADFNDRSVPDAARFFALYGKLTPNEYRTKITETYGPAAGRDKILEAIVNAAVLMFAAR